VHIDKKFLHKVFVLIAGSIVFAWLVLDTERVGKLLSSVWNLITPFVLGAAIAFVFNVPMRAIENQLDGIHKVGVRRTLSILLTLFALVLVIMFVVELLVPQIKVTVDALTDKIPAFVERTANSLMLWLEENPDLKAWVYETTNLENMDWANLLKNALSFLSERVSTWMGSAVNVIGNVTSGIFNTVIGLVFALYCLAQKDNLGRQGRSILYALLPEKTTDEIIRILRLTNVTFSNFISGQGLEAVILGALFAVGMAIFRMPYIPLVSVTIAMTAFIPYVGAFIGCAIGAFFILVNDPLQALSFIALFLVLQQLENNLIYPRVVGTSIGLPGMWVLVAVTVGGELMGIGGMLLMIPLASVLYTLLGEFTHKRLAERNIPEEKLIGKPLEIKSQFRKNRERKQNLRLRKMQDKLKEKMQKK
jgi:predicted PurR-regulated permease PerM